MTTQYVMRVRYKQFGGHTHMRIFAGKEGGSLSWAGNLTFTNEEFDAWKLNKMSFDRRDGNIVVEFRKEVDDDPKQA